jgi:hypothetical protein
MEINVKSEFQTDSSVVSEIWQMLSKIKVWILYFYFVVLLRNMETKLTQ